MVDVGEVIIEALNEMYEEAEPSADFDHILSYPEEYDDWQGNHYLSQERQREIVRGYADKYDLSKNEEAQLVMNAILYYGPTTSENNDQN